MRKFITTILFTFILQSSFAQIDTEFWFAAPDVSSDFGYDAPIYLRVTSFQQPCQVIISIPANPSFIPQTISLTPNTTQSINLTTWKNDLECFPGNVVNNKGLHVVSDNKIAVYYEVSAGGPNPEFFALKGRNALGTSFLISSQYILDNSSEYSPQALSSFNIVASEDNTTVTIVPTKSITGHAPGIPFSVTLNRGQTYAAIATSQAAADHLQGSSVNSNKPVAITLADDLLNGGVFGSTCRDLAGDQTVPINVIGTEYIAIRSNLNFPRDKVYITAAQNGTTITQDGAFVTTINAAQSYELTINGAVTYIQLSKPAYAYQLSGYGCEVGSAVLPKIICTGSPSVSIARSTTEEFSVCLLVKNGGQAGFLINGQAGIITAGNFTVVPGTAGQWYFAKITLPLFNYPVGNVVKISNSITLFQEGVLAGSTLGNGFGYFSDFNTLLANASAADTTLCLGDNIQLIADSIPSATYSWIGPGGFTSNFQNPIISNVNTINSGSYILTVNVPDCGIFKDTVAVSVYTPTSSIINQAICQGQSFAGYTASGTYIDVFVNNNGCDSTRTINLIVKPKFTTTVNQTICEGQTFLGYSSSGTFVNTFVAANGCDSVRTLILIVKARSFTNITQIICEGQTFQGQSTSGVYNTTLVAANGCDSVVTLNLTVKPRSYSNINQSVCQGQVYLGYSTSGTFVDTLTSANGCDSIRTLNLIVKPTSASFINQTICQGQSYDGYSNSGNYVDTLVGYNGCDSVRTLTLIVIPSVFTNVSQTICEGNSYLGYTQTGTYIDVFSGTNGCDSIRTLTLSVKPRSTTILSQSICEGQVFEGHTTSGIYTTILAAANGCDSVVTLTLTVKPRSITTINQSICQGQTYEGYSSNGTYIDNFVAANGCDSIRTLNLIVKPTSVSFINQTICQGQSYGGHTNSGNYVDTLVGYNGCDSVRTLTLIVNAAPSTIVSQNICQGNSYLGYTVSGTYIDIFTASNGCDSARTLNLNVIPKYSSSITKNICNGQYFEGYNQNGTYIDTLVSVAGCDSIRTIYLTVENPVLFDLGPDRRLCIGDTILLQPGVLGNYLWQNGTTQNSYNVIAAGNIFLSVTNSCGTFKDSIKITTENCRIIFPNAFTPNGDNINDDFKALNSFLAQDFQLVIYNRWGEKVFETKDFKKGWDGKYKGIIAEVGAYVWYCSYELAGLNRKVKGTVVLIR